MQRFNELVRRLILVSAVGVITMLSTTPSIAHQGSEGYVYLTQADQGQGLNLVVDVALRDLDVPLQIDADANGQITSSELTQAWPAIDAHVKSNLRLAGCVLQSQSQGLTRHNEAVYASLTYMSDCKPQAAPAIHYSLFKNIDVNHRATARIDWGHRVTTEVLNPQMQTIEAHTNTSEASTDQHQSLQGDGWLPFVREGVHHIVTGYDHVLFLLCLLLPAVMQRKPAEQGPSRWTPVTHFRQALWPVLGIVTAFTLAHSITLTLAALKWVSIPSSIIEPAIAVTIVLAALDNLRPVMGRRRAWVTFAFGLVHGFGFAGVLEELQLPAAEFASALLQFNLGLELGQIAIVGVVAGLLFVLRHARAYVPCVIQAGSVLAIMVALVWFVERTADVSLFPSGLPL